jgi:hypothetical protein
MIDTTPIVRSCRGSLNPDGRATLVVIPTSVGDANLDALATAGVLRFVETIRSET